jgi:hypothetical protein
MGDLLDGWAALEADRALWRVGGVAVLAVPEAWAASTDDIGSLDRRAASRPSRLGDGRPLWPGASAAGGLSGGRPVRRRSGAYGAPRATISAS